MGTISEMQNTALHAKSLACVRRGVCLFSNLSFRVPSGSALIIRGHNGAGKSTLLHILIGLRQPVTGDVQLNRDGQSYDLGPLCHYIGHKNAVKPSLTVTENLEFWRNYNGNCTDSSKEALLAVNLTQLTNVLASNLSTGQRKRLCLAKLLVSYKPVWILDEPFVALDRSAKDNLVDIIRKYLLSGGITVIVTHQQIDNLGPHEVMVMGGGSASVL